MQSITTLNLNLQYPNYTTTMYAVQHDRLSRKITAMLFDGSVPFEPEYGTLAVVRYKKPDGTCGFYDTDDDGNTAVTWNGNTATIMLAEQALTVAGTVLCQVQFYNSGEQRLSSFTWKINVEENACTDDTITSSDYFNVLTQQIAAILDVISDIPAPATILPLMDGTAAIGTRGEFARSDHVHPTDTSITNKIGNTPLTTTAQTLTGGINEVNLSGGLNRGNLPSSVTTINGLMNLDAGVYRCAGVSTDVFPSSYGELQIIKGGAYGVALFYPVNNTSGASIYRRSWNISTSSLYESDWIGIANVVPIEQGGTGATSLTNARNALSLSYNANDTMTISSNIALAGIMTYTQNTFFDVSVEKSMENISSVSATTLSGYIVGVNGALDNSTSSSSFLGSGYTVTCTKQENFHVRIGISKSSAFGNATAYTPVTFFGTLALKFT